MGFSWANKTVAVTGGAGSFGRAFVRSILRQPIRSVRVISRDEFKHAQMQREFNDPRIRYLLGDVRDRDRLLLAFDGIDVVVHAAALKRVEKGESDPLEFVRTNVTGAENVIHAAREHGVDRVVALSSDKACAPTTLYGATKMLAERLFVAANVYTPNSTKYGCVRYGNVTGSRGSLIPLLLEQRKTGRVTLTDPRMTRFWMHMDEAVELVKWTVENMAGGEVVVPRLPSVRITDVIEAVAPGCEVDVIGLRSIEKLHEQMIAADEWRNVQEQDGRYVIRVGSIFDEAGHEFAYSSETNTDFLTVAAIRDRYESALAEAA